MRKPSAKPAESISSCWALEIDSAGFADGFLIGGAVLIVIAANGSVGNVDVAGIHVDVREEMLAHEMMKTLRMRRGKSEIFVKIESNDAREIERTLLAKPN